jgi:hypothetical protein
LAQAQSEAMGALDEVITRIEKAHKPAAVVPAPSASTAPVAPAPVVRARRVIKPADLSTKPYLENREDVDAFLDALRLQLEAALAKDERIQIR